MVSIDVLFKEGKISLIRDLELNRYISFFENSFKDNLWHSAKNVCEFPRWSIISGYYAMHDISKLIIAKRLKIKVDFEVHSTTIKILKEMVNDIEVVNLFEKGYAEFLSFANDLDEAKKERTKMQYYTGTGFLKEEYKKKAMEFYTNVVLIYVEKIKRLYGVEDE